MDPLFEFFEAEKKQKIERYRRLNKFVRPGQILLVGSSLMEQFPIYEFIQDYAIDKTIYNRGVGGYTTTELLEVLDVCIFDLEPSKIFINIGTNDMNGEDYKVEQLIMNYEKILIRIKERLPQAKLYLMAYYPVNREAAKDPWMAQTLSIRTNDRICTTNREVAALASRYGAEFIDVNRNISDEEGRLKAEYTIEGMHMYGDGYQALLEDLMPYLIQ
jgi:lysophospholipase L1-like esterase